MEFREKHLVILNRRVNQVSVNLPGEKQAAQFGALDAKIAWEMEDTPALPPQMTFEEKCRHQMLWIIYSNACEESLDNDTSIKCSLNLGGLFI